MEQAAPDPERLLQPAPLEPLSHPDAGLESMVGEETKGARDEGPGDGTVRRRGGRGPPPPRPRARPRGQNGLVYADRAGGLARPRGPEATGKRGAVSGGRLGGKRGF